MSKGWRALAIDDISHAVAGMLKRRYQDHPTFCDLCVGLWSGLGQAQAHDSGVFGAAHRAHQSALYECAPLVHLGRSGAQALARLAVPRAGSTLAKLRACLDALPACKALIKRFRADAVRPAGVPEDSQNPGALARHPGPV